VAIFDYEPLNAKTGIAHRTLKPLLGIVDPENTRTMPPAVAAASGFDVLCHSLESWTAIPFNLRGPRPTRPLLRPAYQGSNRAYSVEVKIAIFGTVTLKIYLFQLFRISGA
jgi:hydroxyacid-oxoacid transhydrogenase